jgi:UDP-N-acetylmuramate-alanine ligase
LGIEDASTRSALANFGGVKRRFTRVGEWHGVQIIDDYGHHPVEIAAVLRAARESAKGKIIAVIQPHRYTRLHDLFDQFCTCFNDADAVIVAPVYPAGEQPIPGADRDALVTGLRAHGHKQAFPLEGPEKLPSIIKKLAKPDDYVVCLGAGSITQWAYALPAEPETHYEFSSTRASNSKPECLSCAGGCWQINRSENSPGSVWVVPHKPFSCRRTKTIWLISYEISLGKLRSR